MLTVKENLLKQSKIQRRPSRILVSARGGAGPPGTRVSGPLGIHTSPTIVVLRILLPQIAGLDGITITLNVATDMTIGDAVAGICAKRGIENPREWVLMTVKMQGSEPVVLASNDIVASLGESLDVSLVRRRDIGGGMLKFFLRLSMWCHADNCEE